ncbi:MAG: M67 family metallopeptidase [Nitrospina sp.]|jgi:[CysO sulfur-carrier protein]-S-L-cysteine hydrolase|nr:M67 family metallopeptidase [Nitrospina sp.]MBT6601346.1 M67 family metallopeptidase [Nitrospina sp.]
MSIIHISQDNLEQIRKHALEEYPFECCGIIAGLAEAEENDILFRCTNIQNKLHKMDPEAYPRDAKTAYNIDPGELLKIFKQTESIGMTLKVFYHSHPDHDAYFSDEDKKMALFDGEPTYPNAKHLVVSVYNKVVRDEAWFKWNSQAESFKKIS